MKTRFGLILIAFLMFPVSVFAGNIDASYNTATWERADLGDVNFALTQGDVTVTDTAMTGYAWSEDLGWINLNPDNGGVANDGEGNLSGYAWGENTGWINFNPDNGGVIITQVNSTHSAFSGYAWSEGHGWLHFNNLRTTWIAATGDTGGGEGGNPPSDPPPSVTPPTTVPPPSTTPTPPSETSESGGSIGTCGDGLDNDNDGLPDGLDPGCHTDGNPNNPDSYDPRRNTENTPPRIVLEGLTAVEVDQGSSFEEPGFRAFDEEDGDITSSVRIEGDVDTQTLGAYEIRYQVTDSAGQTYTVVRRVIVQRESLLTSLIDLGRLFKKGFDRLAYLMNTPTGDVVTKGLTTSGLLVGLFAALSSLFANPLTFAELFLIPFRVGSLFTSFLGYKRRNKPWGTVYDSVTKQPLDPAQVTLMDANGNEIDSILTDLDGRFGFLVEAGTYQLVAGKTNYEFPSKKLAGKTSDSVYPDLYFGGPVTVDEKSNVVSRNIPLDPVGFDWNEFAKREDNLMLFYSKYDRLLLTLADFLFYIGFFIAIVALFAAPQPYNYLIFGTYILLLVLRFIGVKHKQHGKVVDERTGKPLSFAVIRVLTADNGNLILKTAADKYGRYFALISNGNYIVEIDQKIGEDEYDTVFRSQPFKVTKGMIKRPFNIT